MTYPDLQVNIPNNFSQPLAISVDGGKSWTTPDVIEYGMECMIGFGLKNAGLTDAENVPVKILVNDTPVIDITLKKVSRGGSYFYCYGNYFWEPGEYTIKYVLDPENIITESDEANNVFTYTLRVEDNGNFFPDLTVRTPENFTQPLMILPEGESTWIAPETYLPGTSFLIGFGVKNAGHINALNVPYQIKVNDTVIIDNTLKKLSRGGNYFYNYGMYGFDPGEYTITLTLDPYDVIKENNEENNTFSYTLTVPGNQDWLIPYRWCTGTPLMDSNITLEEYMPIDPESNERTGANCGVVAAVLVAAYFVSQGYDFTVELTEDDACSFNDRILLDGSSENAAAYKILSFAEINALLEEFDTTSAEDAAALCYATGVIMANIGGNDNFFRRLGYKSVTSAYRDHSDLWTADKKLSDKAWEMLIRNINAKRPVLTGVPDPHVIIIDGYDARTDMVHIYFNFGIANGKRYSKEFGNNRGNGWYTREECDALELTFFTYDIIPDTTAPLAGEIACSISGKCAELSLDFTDDVGVWKRYYKLTGDDEWSEFTDKVTVTKNTTVFFRACDKGKNYSDVISYAVTELEAPPTLTITGNPQNWTNKDVLLTATADRGTIEFFNGISWIVSSELIVTANGTYRFRVTDDGGVVTEKSVTVNKIDKIAPLEPTASADITVFTDLNVTVTATFSKDSVIKEYSLDNKTWLTYYSGVVMFSNGTVYFRGTDAAGNVSKIKQYTVDNIVVRVPQNLNGTANALKWDKHPLADEYVVEISMDNYSNILKLETVSNGVDFWGLKGDCQWQVRLSDREEFAKGNNISSTIPLTPQMLRSDADNNIDVFFANAKSKWTSGYAAQHTGILNSWNGTDEQVSLLGKNKLSDIFEGSNDTNILVMTDDANGDALFLEDVYTALGEQARIAQINEIRAGAGDDIVDLTSRKYAYSGSKLLIYGGLGNDTIWTNDGDNMLFGDAGNDRLVGGTGADVLIGGSGNDSMHGGGGNDLFCFGGSWGADTVEQLKGSSVTLWFESGSATSWNADTLTYTDGANSVKVSGISADNITLLFGDNGSVRYDELLNSGCFEDAVSEKIFEDKNKGMLA